MFFNNFLICAYNITMKKENIIKYGNPILMVAIVVLLGSIFTNMGLDWLKSLNKPNEWLKDYVIPIIWGIIYSLFIIFLIYITNKEELNKPLKYLLYINGLLNIVWCLTFFTLNSILLGLILIILNLISSILLIKEIFKINKKWGYVLLLYPSWLSIATCLNLSIWILN